MSRRPAGAVQGCDHAMDQSAGLPQAAVGFVNFGRIDARQNNFTARADRVVELAALAEAKGATHGLRHRVRLGKAKRDIDIICIMRSLV